MHLTISHLLTVASQTSLGVFTWTRITFRKTFQNAIQNVIGIVIWTTFVHMGYKRLSNHDQDLRTASDVLLLLRSPHALIDPCAYAWLQRAFLKCTRTNHVPKQLCVHIWTRIRLSRRITIQNALFSRFKTRFKSLIWNYSFLFTWAKIRLSNQEKAESRFETSFGTWF